MSVGCLAILIFLMIDLSNSIDLLAVDLIGQKKEQAEDELDHFFEPVVEDIDITIGRGEGDFFDSISLSDFNRHFIPFISNSKPISSMMLAQPNGNEKMLLQLDSTWINRHTFFGSDSVKADRYEWSFQKGSTSFMRQWKEDKDYDPRLRPWFTQAIEQNGLLNWTAPYTFFTTKDPGITASRKWSNSTGQISVFAFDLMLTDISNFTSDLTIMDNGKAFILTDDDRVLGLPHDEKFEDRDSLKHNVLKPIDQIGIDVLPVAKNAWLKEKETSECYSFDYDGEKWWSSITTYELGNNTFLIGVVAPESDFLAAIQKTRMMIFGGFILILIFTFFLTRTYRQIRKANVQLGIQKAEVEVQRDKADEEHKIANEQKLIVEEKNKEIMDSINYAERIQKAILPTNKQIQAHFPNSFVYYKPKDVVAGDFYWMEAIDDGVLIAAADCTGHGVPGALVSVVCHNSLNRAVKEFGIKSPGLILDKTTDLVIETFEKSEEEVKDGMDIAMCKINTSTYEVEFAGANNSLYVVKANSTKIIEYKASKQPIGKFVNRKAFETQKIQLEKGDLLYMYTDGYADQFGGPRGKKFKYKQFRELLITNQNLPLQEQLTELDQAFESWIVADGEAFEQIDDVCVIGIKL